MNEHDFEPLSECCRHCGMPAELKELEETPSKCPGEPEPDDG